MKKNNIVYDFIPFYGKVTFPRYMSLSCDRDLSRWCGVTLPIARDGEFLRLWCRHLCLGHASLFWPFD
jgi:hypothetical protein